MAHHTHACWSGVRPACVCVCNACKCIRSSHAGPRSPLHPRLEKSIASQSPSQPHNHTHSIVQCMQGRTARCPRLLRPAACTQHTCIALSLKHTPSLRRLLLAPRHRLAPVHIGGVRVVVAQVVVCAATHCAHNAKVAVGAAVRHCRAAPHPPPAIRAYSLLHCMSPNTHTHNVNSA